MILKQLSRRKKSDDALPASTRAAYVLAPAVVFIVPFLNFLNYQGYGLARPEVFYAGGIIAAVGLLLGAILLLRPNTLGQITLVACILVSLDMSFSSIDIYAMTQPRESPLSLLAWHGVLVIGLLVGARLLYRHFSTIVLTVFAVACATLIAIPGPVQAHGVVLERQIDVESSKRPVVHLVLDEFIGIEGIPTDIPGGVALKEDLKRFFLENGFRLHGAAFSHSSETQHAVASLLNGRLFPSPESAFGQFDGISKWHLRNNAWFEQMAGDGYAIRVFDNTYAGYCEEGIARIESCEIFPANSIRYLEDLAIPATKKAKVILSTFIELSAVTEALRNHVRLPLYRLGPFVMDEAFGRVAEEITTSGAGQLYFAHILSPHYSYVLAADCSSKQDSESWTNRYLPFRSNAEAINTAQSRRERYQAYFAQVSCVQRQLQSFFDRLRSAGRYDETTIIVHGDHGSRISIWNPEAEFAEQLSDRDIIDNFSVLYAVKQPGVPGGYDATARSIQALFAETFLNRPFQQEPKYVFLRGSPAGNGHLRRRFPDFEP